MLLVYIGWITMLYIVENIYSDTILFLGNGLPLFSHQAITWSNIDFLSVEPLGINFSEN